jgi:hypothetical protein
MQSVENSRANRNPRIFLVDTDLSGIRVFLRVGISAKISFYSVDVNAESPRDVQHVSDNLGNTVTMCKLDQTLFRMSLRCSTVLLPF